jgi:hypothetical protein
LISQSRGLGDVYKRQNEIHSAIGDGNSYPVISGTN